MDTRIYTTWAKVQWTLDSLTPLVSKLEFAIDDLADYADDLQQEMLEDSDSNTFPSAVEKYEALIKQEKENCVSKAGD